MARSKISRLRLTISTAPAPACAAEPNNLAREAGGIAGQILACMLTFRGRLPAVTRIPAAIRATVALPVSPSLAVFLMPVPDASAARTAASRSPKSLGPPEGFPLPGWPSRAAGGYAFLNAVPPATPVSQRASAPLSRSRLPAFPARSDGPSRCPSRLPSPSRGCQFRPPAFRRSWSGSDR
jgi:hypothetical protein